MIADKYFEYRDMAFTKACMPLFFNGSSGSSGRNAAQAQRERSLGLGSQQRRDRALWIIWIKEQREESARNAWQDKLELREARAAKIAGAATRKQMLIIQLAEIKEAFKE